MSQIFPIQNDTRERRFIATPGQTVFPVSFLFQLAEDLTVYTATAEGQPETLLTLNVHYGVGGAGNPAGGYVELAAPQAAGVVVHIIGRASPERVTGVTRAGRYDAATLDQELDRRAILDMEMRRDIDGGSAQNDAQNALLLEHQTAIDGLIWANGVQGTAIAAVIQKNIQQDAAIAELASAIGGPPTPNDAVSARVGAELSRLQLITGGVPGLLLNFADLAYYLDRDGGTVDGTLARFLSTVGGAFARDSSGSYFDTTGQLIVAAAHVPREAYDPVTGKRGLLMEPTSYNLITNCLMTGAVVGGAFPSGWVVDKPTGVAAEVVAIGDEFGIPYIDIRFHGLAAAAGAISVTPRTPAAERGPAAGQPWTASWRAVLRSGTAVPAQVMLYEYPVAGGVLAGTGSPVTVAAGALATSRYAHTRVLTEAGTARVMMQYRAEVASGAGVEMTIRLAAPQLEPLAYASSDILSTGSVGMRSADIFTLIVDRRLGTAGTLYARRQMLGRPPAGQSSSIVIRNTTGDGLALRAVTSATAPLHYGDAAASIAGVTTYDGLNQPYEPPALAQVVAYGGAGITQGVAPNLAADWTGALPTGMDRIAFEASAFAQLIEEVAWWPGRLARASLTPLISSAAAPGPLDLTVIIGTPGDPVSPYVFGSGEIGVLDGGLQSYLYDQQAGLKVRRLGGNSMTAYNWVNNANNIGKDWYHWNARAWAETMSLTPAEMETPAGLIHKFHGRSLGMGAKSLLIVPLVHYAAADYTDTPVTEAEAAPSARWKPITYTSTKAAGDPIDTSVVDIPHLLRKLIATYGNASTSTGIHGYLLDNEPGLWTDTHPRLVTEHPTIAEFIARSIEVATVVKSIDPHALVFGPASWGATEYQSFQNASDWPDYFEAGYTSFLEVYLEAFAAASATAGIRLLDVLNIHWYPFSYYGNFLNTTDPLLTPYLLQAPRTLNDPNFDEESWVSEAMWERKMTGGFSRPILPYLHRAIDKYYPGTKLGMGEFNYGGSRAFHTGLALADALGRIATTGVSYACHWGTPQGWTGEAYKLFCNYDGLGSRWAGDVVTTLLYDHERLSAFAAYDGSYTRLILINKSTGVLNVSVPHTTFIDSYGYDASRTGVAELGIKDIVGGVVPMPPRSARLLKVTRDFHMLDGVENLALAYGLRNLIIGYAAPLIRLRRSSDNAEMDFSAAVGSKWVDVTAIMAWVGTGSAYVTRWYDQSGEGLHLTQTTAANQPRLVNAGVLETAPNGRPWIYVEIGKTLRCPAPVTTPGADEPSSMISFYRLDDPWYGGAQLFQYGGVRALGARDYQAVAFAGELVYAATGDATKPVSVTGLFGEWDISVVVNGVRTGGEGYDNPGRTEIIVGGSDFGAVWIGGIGEAVATNRRLNAAEISSIGKNHLTNWRGLILDDMPVAASWGLRRLRTAYSGPLVRLRRSSDNAELDYSAGATGWIDTAAVLAWAGAGSAFVVTWYDQSGQALHVTQATAANQPRLVNAGVLEAAPNGRPWARFADAQRLEIAYAAGKLPTGADPSTLLMVARPSSASSNAQLLLYGDLASSNPRRGLYHSGSLDRPGVTTPAVVRTIATPWLNNMRSVFGSFIPGAASGVALSVDGVATDGAAFAMHSSTPATGTLRLGHISNPVGTIVGIAETAIFTGALSAGQMARLRSNHRATWGTL